MGLVYGLFSLQDVAATAPDERIMASCAVTFVGRLLSSLSLPDLPSPESPTSARPERVFEPFDRASARSRSAM